MWLFRWNVATPVTPANYFATPFAPVVAKFQKLDSWVRMRLHAMKLKRKNYDDNYKRRCNYFACKPALLTMKEIRIKRKASGKAWQAASPIQGNVTGVAR